MTFIATELKNEFGAANLFSQISKLEGETFRAVKDRRTFRFMLGEKAYFAKVHFGVGWVEIFKNLLQLKLPVLGASNEWHAIHRLQELDVDTLTPVAYCSDGMNPARIHSCIVTEALDETISLEDLVKDCEIPIRLKRQLIERVGKVAGALHDNGINHRDFYICHFLLPKGSVQNEKVDRLHLIDLHRAQIRNGRSPSRWREKDIAGLLFSAADAGLTKTDLFRFMRAYRGTTTSLNSERRFWSRVVKKAAQLYRKDHGRSSEFLDTLAIGF